MTSKRPPDDSVHSRRSTAPRTDGPADDTTPEPDKETAEPDNGTPEPDKETAESRSLPAVAPHRSTLRIALVAVGLLFVAVGAAATGTGVAALPAESPTPTTDVGTSNAISADGVTGADPAERPEITGSFARPVYAGVAGDPVDVRHNADDGAYLLIGGNRLTDTGQSVGFVDVVRLTGSETTINTRTLGTDASSVESCGRPDVDCDLEFLDEDGNEIGENLTDLSMATGAGGLPRPIAPQRYRLAIANGTFIVEDTGQITPAETAARAELLLERPTLHEEIEVFTTAHPDDLPAADGAEAESLAALERNGVERTAVTTGDRVVLGFESTGIWGALSAFAADRSAGPLQSGEEVDHAVLTDLLEAEEGVSLRVRQTNPGRNQPRSQLDLSDADPDSVSLLLADATEVEPGQDDSTAGRFYLVLDTGSDGPFTRAPEPGDEFAVEFALEGTPGERYRFAAADGRPGAFQPESAADDGVPEQFPYWDESDGRVSAEASFSVRERFLRYDNVTRDGTLLVEADGGTVTGTTSILPVTELAADFVNDAGDPIRTQSPVEIEDGHFALGADFEGVSPGTRLNYELYEGSTFRESRDVVIVADVDDPDRLAIADAPANVTVAEDDDLAALAVDVRNVGGLGGDGTLTLDVGDGNVTASQELTLASNETRRIAFSTVSANLAPGEYPFTVTLGDDQRNGTLIVENDPAKTTITDDDTTDDDTGGDVTPDDDAENTADDGAPDALDDSDDDTDDSDGDERSPTDAPATLLPFGIGTRETLGGTLLVGATYLLGHWV